MKNAENFARLEYNAETYRKEGYYTTSTINEIVLDVGRLKREIERADKRTKDGKATVSTNATQITIAKTIIEYLKELQEREIAKTTLDSLQEFSGYHDNAIIFDSDGELLRYRNPDFRCFVLPTDDINVGGVIRKAGEVFNAKILYNGGKAK